MNPTNTPSWLGNKLVNTLAAAWSRGLPACHQLQSPERRNGQSKNGTRWPVVAPSRYASNTSSLARSCSVWAAERSGGSSTSASRRRMKSSIVVDAMCQRPEQVPAQVARRVGLFHLERRGRDDGDGHHVAGQALQACALQHRRHLQLVGNGIPGLGVHGRHLDNRLQRGAQLLRRVPGIGRRALAKLARAVAPGVGEPVWVRCAEVAQRAGQTARRPASTWR